MKKMLLTLAAVAAFTGSAYAADLPARMPMKAAPPPPAVANWTGFYIFGGAGGGIWDADTFTGVTGTGVPLSINQRMGGDGWFGTVGAGYDWQFSNWVFGILADGQFGSLKGTIQDPFAGWTGTIKMQDAWAAGARLGYLIAPNVLSYVNAGYSGSHWSGTEFFSTFSGAPIGTHTGSFNRNGFFIGGGAENSLNIFGISAPGWFMKTEYRAAYYGSWGDGNSGKVINELVDGTNVLVGRDINFKPWVQTIETSLVYRFNWGGPVVARY